MTVPVWKNPDDISRDSGLPLHYQLQQLILRLIANGTFKAGDLIPTEQEWSEAYGLSRTTVRQALNELARDGTLERVPGKGTFVRSKGSVFQGSLTELTGFVEDMQALGIQPHSRRVEAQTVPAGWRVGEHLHLDPAAPVLRIRWVVYIGEDPIMYQVVHWPAEIGQRLLNDEMETMSVFAMLEQQLGYDLLEANYRLGADIADATIASLLQVPKGSPLLTIERTTHAASAGPVMYENLYYRGDRIRYVMNLKRNKRVGV